MNFFRKLVQRLIPAEGVTTEERRESVRLDFEVQIQVEWSGQSRSAKLVNLTFTGLCLQTDAFLEVGQELVLRRDEVGPPFGGTVLWCKPKEGGQFLLGIECELDEEKLIDSWLEPTLIEAGFLPDYLDEKRTLVRVSGNLECKLFDASGEELGGGKLVDLSLGGALLEWPSDLEVQKEVRFQTERTVDLAPLEGSALVASCRSGKGAVRLVGLQFKQVDQDLVRTYMATLLKS